MMLPRFMRNVPGMTGGANHSPEGSRTASPGTSCRASAVTKLLSVCGAWPNRLSSSAGCGGECRKRRMGGAPFLKKGGKKKRGMLSAVAENRNIRSHHAPTGWKKDNLF